MAELWGEPAQLAPDPQRALVRRIVGVETEYGVTCVSDGGNRRLGADEIARYMFRPVVEEFASSNVFIPNGSRLYLDVGSHPEYASAECDSIRQLLAYERAGDVIVDRLGRTAEQALDAEGIGGQVYLFKNNIDSFGNSYGCHENYLVSRGAALKTLGQSLLPFLVTRQLLCGAGSIQQGAFQISQRADHVWEGVSSATTRSRPIINTRDEPHADSHKYRRLHVIVGDSNMSECSTALKVGAMFLVLEMIEAGYAPTHLALADDMAAIRTISRDYSAQAEVELADHSMIRAIDIQRAYLEAAQRWLEVRPESASCSNEELQGIIQLWERVVNALDSGDFAAIEREVDWVIKLKLLRQFQQRLGVDPTDFSHPKLQQVDLTYHDIRPERGLFYALAAKGLVARIISDDEIMRAVDTPPATTRAALRGQFLEVARALGAPTGIDWLRLKVNRPEPQIVELQDPFANQNPAVDELLDYMKQHAETYGAAASGSSV